MEGINTKHFIITASSSMNILCTMQIPVKYTLTLTAYTLA